METRGRKMATPNAQDNPLEANTQLVDFSAQAHTESAPPGIGPSQPGATSTSWLNFGFLSIGAVGAIGLLLVLFGAYVVKPENANLIIAGSIILLISVVAWVIVASIMIIHLFRHLVALRRDKQLRTPPTQQQ